MSAPAPTTSAGSAVEAPAPAAPDATLTSKDYYFDSYAHFGKFFKYWNITEPDLTWTLFSLGIHEVSCWSNNRTKIFFCKVFVY